MRRTFQEVQVYGIQDRRVDRQTQAVGRALVGRWTAAQQSVPHEGGG